MPAGAPGLSASRTNSLRRVRALLDRHRQLLGCVLGVAGTTATTAVYLSLPFARIDQPAPIIFLIPIILAAYLGGLAPGLLTTLLATLTADFLLMEPRWTLFVRGSVDQVRLVTLVLEGILVSFLSEALHRSRERARDSEKTYRLVAENISDVVWVRDVETLRLRYISPSVERLRGFTVAEALAQDMAELLLPHSVERIQQAIRERLAEFELGSTVTYRDEIELLRRDGTTVWTETTTRYHRNEETGRIEIYGNSRDISIRKMAEQALEESEERFRILVEQASDAVFLHDHDGRFVLVNRRACESLGFTREELLTMSVTDVEQDFDLPRAQNTWDQVQLDQAYTIYGHQRRKDGSIFPVEARMAACHIRGRRLYIGLVRDITDRERAKQALEEMNTLLEERVAERTADLVAANAELESFSYSVSHDLRAPLRAIDGFARNLSEGYSHLLDATGLDYLNRVAAAANRMGRLIDDLLNLSRITRAELTLVPVDVSRVVRGLAEEMCRAEAGRLVELVIAEEVTIEADPRLLRILLENLLGNAFKFSSRKPRSRIEFGSRPNGDRGRVCFIRDNGAGFDMTYAHKLFSPFQRLHSLREFPGTGIGLAIVQRIVKRHRGRVWGEAEPDQGATFYFSLDP